MKPAPRENIDPARLFTNDIFTLQAASKAHAASYAGVQPSALSHWLKGRPSVAHDKLAQVLAFIGLKIIGDAVHYRDTEELISPRAWRIEDDVMDTAARCLERAREQYGTIEFAIPADTRGAALLFSADGRWGAVQRCNPVLLVGHSESAARVGPGVIQRILDGDTKALIDATRIVAYSGYVDLAALDIASSIRDRISAVGQPQPAAPAETANAQEQAASTTAQWGDFLAIAANAQLSPSRAKRLLRRFLSLSPEEQDRFLLLK